MPETIVSLLDTLRQPLPAGDPATLHGYYQQWMQRLLQAQLRVTADILACTTFEEIAQVLAAQVLRPNQVITILLIEETSPQPAQLRSVATATPESSQALSNAVPIAPSTMQLLRTLLDDTDILVADVATDPRLDEGLRTWFMRQRVTSCYIVAMRRADQPYGFIALSALDGTLTPNDTERSILLSVAAQASAVIEKEQLLSRAIVHADETQMLYDISSRFVQAASISDMMLTLYRTMGQGVMHLDMNEIQYADDGTLRALVLRHRVDADGTLSSPDTTLSPELTPQLWQELAQKMAQTGDALEAIADQTTYSHPLNHQWLAQGIGSSVMIPLLEDGRPIVQIMFAYAAPRAFSERTLRVLSALQVQFLLVLQNRRLLESARENALRSTERLRVLGLLNQITQVTNRDLDEATVLQTAAELLQQYVQVDHVGIAMVDLQTGIASIAAESPSTGMIGTALPDDDQSLLHILERTRAELQINDVATSRRISEELRTMLLGVGSRSLFLLPLLDLKGELLGSIGFDMQQPFAIPNEISLEMARTVAAQLSLEVQKLRLFDTTQRLARREALINTISARIQATSTVEAALTAAARSLNDLLQATRVSIRLGVPESAPVSPGELL